VRDWLAAWTEDVRERVRFDSAPKMTQAEVTDLAKGAIGSGGPVPVVVRSRVATGPELKAAFAAASLGVALPAERQLLAEAIVYATRHQYRHAVINACSAAEVALSKAAAALLARAGRTRKERDDILEGASRLIELYRLNATGKRGLAVSIGRAMDQLARPRNRAVHEGKEPDEETATKAIRTARALLEVAPLPSPRSFRYPPSS
jgi:HEPN domain